MGTYFIFLFAAGTLVRKKVIITLVSDTRIARSGLYECVAHRRRIADEMLRVRTCDGYSVEGFGMRQTPDAARYIYAVCPRNGNSEEKEAVLGYHAAIPARTPKRRSEHFLTVYSKRREVRMVLHLYAVGADAFRSC